MATMIEDTSKRDPIEHLIGAMEDPSSYITGMESAGQHQVVNSDQLPTAAPWKDLEKLGFKRGEEVKGDPLFTHCTLPGGWRRAGTDHAMHSDILDERGVRRVGVFYKAAFYDRRADAHIVNVGLELASRLIWGDGSVVQIPSEWNVLTDDERGDFVQELQRQIDSRDDGILRMRARDALKLIGETA